MPDGIIKEKGQEQEHKCIQNKHFDFEFPINFPSLIKEKNLSENI